MRVAEHAQCPATAIMMESKEEKVSENTIAISSETPEDQERYVNMASGWVITILGWSIWGFIAGLNVYLIVMLCLHI